MGSKGIFKTIFQRNLFKFFKLFIKQKPCIIYRALAYYDYKIQFLVVLHFRNLCGLFSIYEFYLNFIATSFFDEPYTTPSKLNFSFVAFLIILSIFS